MVDVTDELKSAARSLHRAVLGLDPASLKRVRVLREIGFNGWSHLTAMLGVADAGDFDADFGTFLYPKRGGDAFWNIWSASYDEARTIREQHGGYLLAYKRQFFIVEDHFIAEIGLDPKDPDWETIGRDWVRPADPEARGRLTAKLIHHRLTQQEHRPAPPDGR